jgi:putative RecB family exonuclease
VTERQHRSVSQYNQYKKCPYAYKLERIDKVWSRPAAWLAQGSAVHEAAEAWERSGRVMPIEDMVDVYTESYEKHINAACEVTPNFDWWFASGRYGGEEDTERRYLIGVEQCGKYIDWYTNHPAEVIWIAPDGTPGIEIGFDIDLDGVLVRGFIDAVIDDQSEPIVSYDGAGNVWSERTGQEPRSIPNLIVRDNKTGNRPGDDFQLGVYAVALQETYGLFGPYKGDYWMGKTGKATYPFDLRNWTREKVSAEFRELEDNIAAERFDPKPSPDNCRMCSVSYSCEFSAV